MFYLKHRFDDNNLVIHNYVEFEVTEEMAIANPGMNPGLYSLNDVSAGSGSFTCYDDYIDSNGICNSSFYNENVNSLKNAFGYENHPERCILYENGDYAEFSCFVRDYMLKVI